MDGWLYRTGGIGRAVVEEGYWGDQGGGLHPVCRDGVGSQVDVQIVGYDLWENTGKLS